MVHFEALEQTLRLRLVSGHVDKKFFLISRNSLSRTVYDVTMVNEHAGVLKTGSRQMHPSSFLISRGPKLPKLPRIAHFNSNRPPEK
jgi:hypothetical protein